MATVEAYAIPITRGPFQRGFAPMARSEHVLSVFVSSPNDVKAEREKLEEVVRELNIAWGRTLGVRLELVQWETHAYPGVGVDAQAVINEQLPEDYDLFVGIMWCRYGTPTGRAGSGTVEEFTCAKARYDADPESVGIMMYFKEEPVAPGQLDLAQLEKRNAFRESLGDEGVLYWSFNGPEQFDKLVRLHLTRQVQRWKSRLDSPSATGEIALTDSITTSAIGDEDEGILDLMEVFEDRFDELLGISTRIAAETEAVGQKMEVRTADLRRFASDPHRNASRNDAKRLISLAASDMKHYASRLDSEVPLFRDAMSAGMNAFVKAAAMSVDTTMTDEGVQQAMEGLEAAIKVRDSLGVSRTSLAQFRDIVAGLPRMTTELNRAKKSVAGVLEALIDEFTNGESLLIELEKVVRERLAGIEPMNLPGSVGIREPERDVLRVHVES